MASMYRTTNATLQEEVKLRKYFKDEMDNGRLDSIDKKKPYAIAYGLADNKCNRKLFKWSPVFYTAKRFDDYVKKHRQIVLAIYSHREEETV